MVVNKEKIRAIIGIIIAFITAVFIFLFALCSISALLTTKQYIIHTVNSSKYLDNATEMLKDGLSGLAIPSGLPENFFDNKINTDALNKMNVDFINSCYDTGSATVDTSNLKQEFVSIFKDYANSGALASNVDINDEALSFLADECVKKYVTVSANDIFKYICIYSARVNGYIIYGVGFMALFCVFGALFLKKLSKKDNKNYIYFALCGSGLMSFLVPAFLLLGGFIKKISISSRAMHTFVSSFLNNGLLVLLIFGALLILISLYILFEEKIKLKLFRKN